MSESAWVTGGREQGSVQEQAGGDNTRGVGSADELGEAVRGGGGGGCVEGTGVMTARQWAGRESSCGDDSRVAGDALEVGDSVRRGRGEGGWGV